MPWLQTRHVTSALTFSQGKPMICLRSALRRTGVPRVSIGCRQGKGIRRLASKNALGSVSFCWWVSRPNPPLVDFPHLLSSVHKRILAQILRYTLGEQSTNYINAQNEYAAQVAALKPTSA